MLIWQQTLLARAIKSTIINAPGPTSFTAGGEYLGYYGETAATSLITGNDLANRVGLTAGSAQNSTGSWLKFKHNDKVLFVARSPYRHSISWQDLSNLGLVSGDKTVTIGSNVYKIRLMTGAAANPYGADEYGLPGSEMCDLLGNLSEAGSWKLYPDLFFAGGDGNYTWCQEYPAANSANRLMGAVVSTHPDARNGIYYFNNTATDNSTFRGWRPVLEYVGPADSSYTFQLLSSQSVLDASATVHGGASLTDGGIRIQPEQYLTLPSDVKYAFGTGDFTIRSEFIIHSHVYGTNTASTSSVTTFLFWGTWWHTNKLNNWELIYNNLTNVLQITNGNFDTRKTYQFPVTFTLGAAYNIRLTRVAGVLTLYVNDLQVGQPIAFPESINMNVSAPIRIGQRLGGSDGTSIWWSNMTLRSFDITS